MNNTHYQKLINNLHSERNESISTLKQWVEVNSGSENLEGIATMATLLETAFLSIGATVEKVSLPPQKKINDLGEIYLNPVGSALKIRKHPLAPTSILLAGHMDTVYGIKNPFQKMTEISPERLRGPGVADMKGGLLVMFKALQTLEKSSFSGNLGWEVIINPDEEIGSPGSSHLFVDAAKRHSFGLVYEPAFPDGSLVSSRKGSVNYTLIAKGRSAHAGRDFHLGRNAIAALARCVGEIDSLSSIDHGTTVNVAYFTSHFPSNVVPDLASCRINVRSRTALEIDKVDQQIHQITKFYSNNGIDIALFQESSSPPKPFDTYQQSLYSAIKETGDILGLPLPLTESGGTCDGARLYAHGLPNIDSMGVVGGSLHTPEEYCITESIIDRAKLSALLLLRIASGELTIDLTRKLK